VGRIISVGFHFLQLRKIGLPASLQVNLIGWKYCAGLSGSQKSIEKIQISKDHTSK
jgi:hypothetical protein